MVRVNKIPVNGAKHEVTEESGMQVVNDYSDALFKDWMFGFLLQAGNGVFL